MSKTAPALALLTGLLAALLLGGCGTPKLHPYELAEAEIGAPGVQRVGLLPLNALLPLPPELDDATDRVTALIRDHLERCEVRAVPFGLADTRRVWNEISDTESPADAAEEKVRGFVQRLHEERPFDVLVQPSLVYRDAGIRQLGKLAKWDGVEREIPRAGHVNMHGSLYVEPELHGEMPGVSLHLAVYRLDGRRVFESYGGLDLVHEVEFSTVYVQDLNNRFPRSVAQWRIRRKRLRDEDALREGVAMAFTPWLDPPAPPAGEAAAP